MQQQLELSKRNIFLIAFGWHGFYIAMLCLVISTVYPEVLPYPYSTQFYLLVVLLSATALGLLSVWFHQQSLRRRAASEAQ